MFYFKKSTLQKALKKYKDKVGINEEQINRVKNNSIEEDVLIINTHGEYIFTYKSVDELLAQYKTSINEIIYLCNSVCSLTSKNVETKVLNLIYTLARMLSVVPASQGCHDIHNAGLFKHSLLVCKFALHEYLNSNLVKNNTQDNLVYALVILALVHDLGKIFCDFKVKVYKQDVYFDPYTQILDEFLQKHKCEYLSIDYSIAKNYEHDDLIAMLIGRFLHEANSFELLANLANDGTQFDLKAYFVKEGELWQIVKKADAYCVALHNSKAINQLEVAPFLMAKLKGYLKEHRDLINVAGGLAYNTSYGCVIPYDGDLVYLLCHWYGQMSLGSNLEQSHASFGSVLLFLRKKGFLTFFGRNRIYTWHRITIDKDTILVKGFILKGLSLNSTTVNCVLLGDKPSELAPLLQDYDTRTIAGQIVLKNLAHNYEYDNQCIACAQYISGQARTIYEELLSERNKQRIALRKDEFNDFKSKVNAQKAIQIKDTLSDDDLDIFDELLG